MSSPVNSNQTRSVRRLAAIMFTDMVGFTALSQRDESLALEILEKHRKILRPVFARYGGREVKTIGDAFLVEFGSALEAVRSALEIQHLLRGFDETQRADGRIPVRIGIHVGDVVQSDLDVYGDAVNIASRIEPLAEPGGICITQQVYDQVNNKLEIPMTSIGKRELKNVETPIEIYRVSSPSAIPSSVSGSKLGLDRRRVAVLPLVSLTSDPEDEFFSDGLTEEMISTISQIQELRVISRTSIMRFKKASKSLGEIGRELGVGSVLEGSMRKYGKKIRVTAQLIDVETDEHLWSQNYDRDLSDVFAIQSDIAKNIAESLKIRLVDEEKRRIEKTPTKSSEAHALYLKGRHYWNERNESGLKRAIEYFEKAIEKDPDYALSYVGIADCYSVLGEHGYVPMREAASKSKELATKALEHDDSLAEAHTSLASALTASKETSRAEREFKKAIELNPNYATAHHWYAIYLTGKEKKEEAISEAKKARELDPLSMQIRTFLAVTYYYAERYNEAQKELEECTDLEPSFSPAHVWLAIVYSEKHLFEEAIREAEKCVVLSPSTRSKSILGYANALAGRIDVAEKIYEELTQASKSQFISNLDFASLCIGMGRYEEAIDWLERANQNSELLSYQLIANWNAPLRSYKRFQDLMAKVRQAE
ncbi:MAG TPA: adenylate/guanylate cyclase domain-containing protein [Nitrososphaerales archaeon]|nr:adenylate/guanylate cyclase domain-containing protein [Nitrososphaerales archaeon]